MNSELKYCALLADAFKQFSETIATHEIYYFDVVDPTTQVDLPLSLMKEDVVIRVECVDTCGDSDPRSWTTTDLKFVKVDLFTDFIRNCVLDMLEADGYDCSGMGFEKSGFHHCLIQTLNSVTENRLGLDKPF